jgi:hypothetical protein
MRTLYLILFITATSFISCQKSVSDFDPSTTQGTGTNTNTPPSTASGSFVATVDGKALSFSVTAATLVRSQAVNEKRMDVTGTSTDGTKRITLTLGEETYQGNAVSVKKYILNPFPDDDPSTPDIDESLYTQGYTTYGTSTNGNWIYGVYDENGICTVSSCDASKTLITATFATTLTDLTDTTNVIKITAGKLTNIKYSVLN